MASLGSLVMRSNTEVYVRVLPQKEMNPNQSDFKVLDDAKNVYVRCWQDFAKGKDNPVPNYFLFETNGIFSNVRQEYIFDTVTGDGLFDRLIYGNNAMIMSYGQTGSGKTLTTTGLENIYEDRGLLPRIMERLFHLKKQLTDKFKICIKLQCVETNRNNLRDLLSENETLFDMNNYQQIRATKVHSLYHGLKLLFTAEARKTVRMRDDYRSNMTNYIATFYIYTKGHNTAVSEGTLHVLDMAGIDTIGNASCAHKNGYEVGNGNLAKSQIEQLILVINENYSKTAELKQRLCINIHYLRKVLNSHSLIRVICHVRVNHEDLKITTSLMRLACAFKGMVPKKLSRFLETSIDVQYQVVSDELKALKKEMDLNAMLCNEDMSYNLSDERFEYIQLMAMDYLEGKAHELVLLSTTDTVLLMKVIRNVYQKLYGTHQELTTRVNYMIEQGGEQKVVRTTFDANGSGGSAQGSATGSVGRGKLTGRAHGSTGSTGKVGKGRRASGSQEVAKKTSSKMVSHSRGDIKSSPGDKRDNISFHSLQSKPAKLGRKGRARSSYDGIKRDSMEAMEPPDYVPSFTTAWNLYSNEHGGRYEELKLNIKNFDVELENFTKSYNKEVHMLDELQNIAKLRKRELDRAVMIKEMDSNAQTSEELQDFQTHCRELSRTADRNVTEQKEKLLKLQTEMRLNLEHRAKFQEELNKKFHEFCLAKFRILIPDVGEESEERMNDFSEDRNAVDKQDKVASEMHAAMRESARQAECSHVQVFDKLRDYMRREMQRLLRKKADNRKWVQTFR